MKELLFSMLVAIQIVIISLIASIGICAIPNRAIQIIALFAFIADFMPFIIGYAHWLNDELM